MTAIAYTPEDFAAMYAESGVAPVAEGADQAALAAFASDLLRAHGEDERELARLAAREEAEVARVRARYAPQRRTIETRMAIRQGALERLAQDLEYPKGKKSLTLAYGTIGRRQVAERLAVLHAPTVLAWAEKAAPTLVRVVEKKDVPHAGLVAYFKETGELPEGCDYVPAHDTVVIKPELGDGTEDR